MLNTEMLKARMKEKSVTQKEIADVLGIAPPTVSQKINGIRPMDLEEAKTIAERLDIDSSEFGFYFFSNQVAQRNSTPA